ncbi:MAG: CsgG/HfaB family protein [Acidobacteriota bacterium]
MPSFRNMPLRHAVLYSMAILLMATSASADWPWKKKKERERARQEAIAQRVAFEDTAEWEGFFKDEDGHPYRMEKPVEKNSDEDWMTLEFTEYVGNKSRVAIWKVENRVNPQAEEESIEYRGLRFRSKASTAPLQGIEEIITSSLYNTNRFDVIERKQVEAILAEQDFGASDRVSDESAARIGRLLGAEYMLFTSINEWTPKKRTRGTAGFRESVAEVALSLRVVHAETAKVEFAGTFRANSSNRSIRVPFFRKSDVAPVNYAMAACVNKAIYRFATGIKVRAWKGAVADVSGDLVTLNGGENRGVEIGQTYRAIRKGKELIDPETGVSLGFRQEIIGTLKVTEVDELWSTAIILEGCEGLKAGDYVEETESRSADRRSAARRSARVEESPDGSAAAQSEAPANEDGASEVGADSSESIVNDSTTPSSGETGGDSEPPGETGRGPVV